MKQLFSIFIIFFFWSSLSYAETPIQFFAETFLFHTSVSGTVKASRSGMLGTEINIDSGFGFDSSLAFMGKIGLILHRKHELMLNYYRNSYSADSTFPISIRFLGLEFSPEVPVSSSLKLQMPGFFYGYRILEGNSGFLAIRPGIQIASYEVELQAKLFNRPLQPVVQSERLISPGLVFAGEYQLHSFFALKGEFFGGRFGDKGIVLIQPLLKISPHRNFSGLIGYRWGWYEQRSQGDLFDVRFSGPAFGLEIIW